MNRILLKPGIIIFALLFYLPCFAQIKNNPAESKLFTEVAGDEKIVAECERKSREYQISVFGRVLPKISGHCWGGCPTRIVLPYYPAIAKELKISGQVKVETIVDETGKVVYTKALQGRSFLKEAALRAAYLSTYTPRKSCYDKPIKFRWIIIYNFH